MNAILPAVRGYNKLVIALLALAMSALIIAACDSGITAEPEAASDEATFGKVEKVAVCHVGHKLPEYDPNCTEGCGDAGKIDLIEVKQSVAVKHLGNTAHSYDGVSDYVPGSHGATGVGNKDSDGNGIDDGCESDPSRPIGTITADILRGGSPPGSDRGVESAAVNLVADAQLWATSSNGAQIAFMNPAGVRSDLIYVASAGEGDGVVTYGEALSFQPFNNTLLTFPMTGAQIISVLEEQCQPVVASRPFQHLGVSDGFTYDLSKVIVAGECTSVVVSNVALNGVPLVSTTMYVVTVNNFLAAGGDNFGTFTTIDPSTILEDGSDLEAIVNYFGANSPVAPPSTDRVNEL